MQVILHLRALFVVFVMFVVLMGIYTKTRSRVRKRDVPELSLKPPTPRTPRTMPVDAGQIAFVVWWGTRPCLAESLHGI
jgi:hypothetical protein